MNLFGSTSQSAGEPDNNDNDGSGFLHPESSLASSRGLHESEWSKERSSQQLELEDSNSRDKRGCCRKLFEWGVKTLHVLNLCFGIALIVYGSLIYSQFHPPAKAAVTFCLILGSIHFLTSLCGIVSYYFVGRRRFGLIISAYIGPYIALVYLTIVISWGMNTEGFLKYLDDHKEVMYLGPNVAENCQRLMPLFYVILIGLGTLEASRWCIVMKMHDRLRKKDRADALIPRSGHTDAAVGVGGASSVLSGRSNRSNNALTEALLDDVDAETAETGGGGAVKKESTGTPNWWDK